MFGEYESESPRVPSPWDSLISSPRSLSPLNPSSNNNAHVHSNDTTTPTPSPLLLPRLVPENDSGNVEYKLQLLNPSPARFTRLVTQLKWRLLEGGGQAYYELGVADSGDLVGLARAELEASLDTLEMMAGEIGASVIVVKEIEVPAGLAERYREDGGKKRGVASCRGLVSYGEVMGGSLTSMINTEAEEDEKDYEDMAMTIVLERRTSPDGFTPSSTNNHNNKDDLVVFSDSSTVFVMDSEGFESDSAPETTDEDRPALPDQTRYAIDLEISSVYKPRPMRKRFHHVQHHYHLHHHHHHHHRTGAKKGKKGNGEQQQQQQRHVPTVSTSPTAKSETPQQRRDRRRAERKQAQLADATTAVNGHAVQDDPSSHSPPSGVDQTDILVGMLGSLHVHVEPPSLSNIVQPPTTTPGSSTTSSTTTTTTTAGSSVIRDPLGDVNEFSHSEEVKIEDEDGSVDDRDSVFGSPAISTTAATVAETVNVGTDTGGGRLIVEVLVVKKLSIEEGFLDFEGFSLS